MNCLGILFTGLLAVGFTLVAARFGVHAVKHMKGPVSDLRINHSFLVFALLLCFGLAAVANLIGITGIVGAYLAGVALSEAVDEGEHLRHQAQALTDFTARFFLVGIGMKLNLAIFRSPREYRYKPNPETHANPPLRNWA